jgi:RNA polymerase sigma-70 factor (sigma-E family)
VAHGRTPLPSAWLLAPRVVDWRLPPEIWASAATFLGSRGVEIGDEHFWTRKTQLTRLVGRNQAKDEFEQFVASSAADLLRTGFLVVWDLSTAEDLVQECLLQVARRWPRVRSMEQPKAYARRILFNLALDGAKRHHRHRSELNIADRSVIEDRHDLAAARALGAVETTSELIDALGALTPRQRAALVLRYFEDLSESEVAEVLGCSVGTVKSTTSRALERLRGVLVPVKVADSLGQGYGENGENDDD